MEVGNGLPALDETHSLILGYSIPGGSKNDLIKSASMSKNGFQSLGTILLKKYITGKDVPRIPNL